jgi:F-type H+-transporting ATPase subunit b
MNTALSFFIQPLFLGISENIKEAVQEKLMQAIDILRYFFLSDPTFVENHPEPFSLTLGIIDMSVAFVLQLIATLILFLVVKYKFWGKITTNLEKRQKALADSLADGEKAKAETQKVMEESNQQKIEMKKKLDEMLSESERNAKIRFEEAKQKNEEEIKFAKKQALEDLERSRNAMEQDIKKEIVSVAADMASKIVKREINLSDNENIIKETLEEMDKKEKDKE